MTPFEAHIELHRQARDASAPICTTCGGVIAFLHDHRPDETGLDDGPWLPGRAPRKKPAPKPNDEIREIRTRAWATRRAKYGEHGHK